MAQLKDTVISGSLRVTDTTYSTKFNNLILTPAATGFTISGGTTSKTLTVGGTYSLGAACAKGVTDYTTVQSPSSSDTNLLTGRSVYYILNQGTSNSGKYIQVDSSGNLAPVDLDVAILYRQFWTSTTSINLSLTEDGKSYYVWCSSSAANGIMDSTSGALIFVSNGKYGIQHKGSGITVSASGSTLTVTSSTAIAMGIVEI